MPRAKRSSGSGSVGVPTNSFEGALSAANQKATQTRSAVHAAEERVQSLELVVARRRVALLGPKYEVVHCNVCNTLMEYAGQPLKQWAEVSKCPACVETRAGNQRYCRRCGTVFYKEDVCRATAEAAAVRFHQDHERHRQSAEAAQASVVEAWKVARSGSFQGFGSHCRDKPWKWHDQTETLQQLYRLLQNVSDEADLVELKRAAAARVPPPPRGTEQDARRESAMGWGGRELCNTCQESKPTASEMEEVNALLKADAELARLLQSLQQARQELKTAKKARR